MIGINPMKDAAKTNIPVLMVRGSVDRRVEYWNLKDYKTAMDEVARKGRVIVNGDLAPESSADASVSGSGGGSLTPASAGDQAPAPTPAVKFLTLEGADHFYNTLMYDHQKLLYTSMLDFLKKDCGPGGL